MFVFLRSLWYSKDLIIGLLTSFANLLLHISLMTNLSWVFKLLWIYNVLLNFELLFSRKKSYFIIVMT